LTPQLERAHYRNKRITEKRVYATATPQVEKRN